MKEIDYKKIINVEVEYEYNTKTWSSLTMCEYKDLVKVINYLSRNDIKIISIKLYEYED